MPAAIGMGIGIPFKTGVGNGLTNPFIWLRLNAIWTGSSQIWS